MRGHSVVCILTYDPRHMMVSFAGPEEIRETLARSLEDLADDRHLEIEPPLDDDEWDWQWTFTTSHAAPVVIESLLGIFDDGFEVPLDLGLRLFSFWNEEGKVTSTDEDRRP